ncbi:type II and III secretion system protein family protein [Phenylobacterium sp. LjRoot225]|uniref:type II and III secretion system protein family protein n=1 Tax=Phenylobacterium sp. LjRoot225 TaxID=3342285 RepID=UPI003ED11768
MLRPSLRNRALVGALISAAVLALAPPASAEVYRTTPTSRRVVYVPRDKSVAFHLDRPASRIVVAQPDTATVRATGGDSFYIQGKELGETNLLIYGANGRLSEILDVRVGYDAQVLQQDLAIAFPGEGIRVRTMGEGVLLTGHVANTGVAARAKALAERFAPQSVTSQLTVGASQQVILEVRVLEASRSVLQDMGVSASVISKNFQFATGSGLLGADTPAGILNLSGKVGSTAIDVQIQALESKGLVRTLARPNLVALSGEKASFLAGGEFPYPIPQNSNGSVQTISLEFRKYGVKLDFKPDVQENGLIRLEVEPEVSKLDQSNSLKVNGFVVPGLITRNAHTVVELRNGASLAIGGLYQRDYQNDMSQVPGLGEIPVLSALFRSARWRRAETELVIIVTPRLAEASDFAKAKATLDLPGDEPSDEDTLLRGKSLDRPIERQSDAAKR